MWNKTIKKEMKDFTNNIFNGEINRMSDINRFSSIPVIKYENVAEHSFYVSIYSLLFAMFLVNNGVKVEVMKLLTRALVHDVDESISGDFLRSFKYSDPELVKIIKRNCERLTFNIFSKYTKEPAYLYNNWLSDKDESLEGCIVKIVDLLTVAIYCKKEIEKGNKNLVAILDETTTYIEECKGSVEKLTPKAKKYVLEFIETVLEIIRKEVKKHG